MGVGGVGELDQDGDAGAGGDREASAESLDALAHAAESIAFSDLRLRAVIGDEERVIAVFGAGEAYAALRGFGVANDVGDRFTNGEAANYENRNWSAIELSGSFDEHGEH